MIGHRRPISRFLTDSRFAYSQIWSVASRLLLHGLAACLLLLDSVCVVQGAEKTARVRLAWGNGAISKQNWTGTITFENGKLTDLQPLGLEVDAPVANRIDGNRLIVQPFVNRNFDGCDLTVRAAEDSLIRIEMRNTQSPQTQVFETTLSAVLSDQFQAVLDDFGSYFLARRTPGDVLRVTTSRDHLVFEPGETWKLKLRPDVASALTVGPVLIDVRLRLTGATQSTWQASQQISQAWQLADGLGFEVPCPTVEGAYRLTVTVRHEEDFATRFVPGRHPKQIAMRELEFVVIDPDAMLPTLVDQWLPMLSIDPANPSWWERLPRWAKVTRLRERSRGSTGNVRPVVRQTPTGELLELPPAPSDGDPFWQSYTLPVQKPGQPHLVEIEYPVGVEQRLAIALVEPDAAGRVTKTEQDASFYDDGRLRESDATTGIHRFMIWPRTKSPQLLIVNQHSELPAQYGKIRLLKQDDALVSLTTAELADPAEELVAAYLSKPTIASLLGATETLDASSGLSVQSWSTFLQGAQRLAQSLRFAGYNGAVLSVAADGSAIYPSRLLNPSPRYDTGCLAASGQDPLRKDALEMLFRIFDREGLRLVPALELSAPLPRLEDELVNEARLSGIRCVDHTGTRQRSSEASIDSMAQLYNPLNDRVQTEISSVVEELLGRYAHHKSFSGLAVQLAGDGYGMMPGLAWGLDDETVARFSQEMSVQLPVGGITRFEQRAQTLLGAQAVPWRQWRQDRLTAMYGRLGEQVANARSDAGLIVLTENLFASPQLSQAIRGAIAASMTPKKVLADHAVDLVAINDHPSVTVVSTSHLIDDIATDEARINAPAVHAQLLEGSTNKGHLTYHSSNRIPMPSFDQRSPFGADSTFLTFESRDQAVGSAARRSLISAIAEPKNIALIDGGRILTAGIDSKVRDLLLTTRELAKAGTLIRTQRVQPLVMHIYSHEDATVLCIVNEAPWSVRAELDLTTRDSVPWVKLGANRLAALDGVAGTTAAGSQVWQVTIDPCDVQAWEFRQDRLRVGDLRVEVAELAKSELRQRIEQIEACAGNLGIERPYPQLQNPSFELQEGEPRIPGWQPRQGAIGSIGLESTEAHSGANSVRLQSGDETGVAIQSHLFANPDTGQLTVRFFLRTNQTKDDSQLAIAIQDQDGGQTYQRVAALSSQQLGHDTWIEHEFSLGDVPIGEDARLRLLFHLTGSADVSLDDISLCDLRFDEARRRSLVKRIHGANIALEQGQLVDCLRVVEDYWSQFLVEHVPPATSQDVVTTKPATEIARREKPAAGEEQKGASRLRGWVPKIWR
ncbi:MAG: hypothetical protein AAGD11_15840 [Planctomycetota bacterium]